MADAQKEYARLRHFKEETAFPPTLEKTLLLKDGPSLERIIPRTILPGLAEVPGEKTLYLYYNIAGQVEPKRIELSRLRGLDIVSVDDPLLGKQPAVKLTYLKSKIDNGKLGHTLEPGPRTVIVTGLYYGTHPQHAEFGESDDIYLEGFDTQYPHQSNRLRRFPFWRIGLYGDQKTLIPDFIKPLYLPVRALREHGKYPENMHRTIKLKNGESLTGIVPRAIMPDFQGVDPSEEKPLMFYYHLPATSSDVFAIPVNQISGLDTVKVNDPQYGECWAIEFKYFKPKLENGQLVQSLEPGKRRVIIRQPIRYGQRVSHESIHAQELPDFYIAGVDIQYADNRERHFPLWRIAGPYGSPEALAATYLSHFDPTKV